MTFEECSVCLKTVMRPALACMACVDRVDGDGVGEPTIYCETECMIADLENHSHPCKSKTIPKQLYRAGEVLQEVFYIWREAMFDLHVSKVWQRRDGKICFQEYSYDTDHDDPILYKFPSHLISDPKIKATLLSFRSCTDSVGYLYELGKNLLQGIATIVEELKAVPRPGALLIDRFFSNGERQCDTRYSHQLLAVESNDGSAYMIDLANAQFGQHRTVIPFHEYMDSGPIFRILKISPHGLQRDSTRKSLDRRNDDFYAPKYDLRTLHVADKAHQYLLAVVIAWQSENCMCIKDLLKLTHDRYQEAKRSFTVRVKDDLTRFVSEWRNGGSKIENYQSLFSSLSPSPASGLQNMTQEAGSTGEYTDKLDFKEWWDMRKTLKSGKAVTKARQRWHDDMEDDYTRYMGGMMGLEALDATEALEMTNATLNGSNWNF